MPPGRWYLVGGTTELPVGLSAHLPVRSAGTSRVLNSLHITGGGAEVGGSVFWTERNHLLNPTVQALIPRSLRRHVNGPRPTQHQDAGRNHREHERATASCGSVLCGAHAWCGVVCRSAV